MGTVVGAGFASGQEILHFVTRFGEKSIPIVFLSTLLFIWTGGKILTLSRQIKAQSYHDLNQFLFGKTFGNWINMMTFIMLIFITGVMLAGAGALFQQYGEFYKQVGILLTAFFVYYTVSRGLNGILIVNSFVVPAMILFNLIIFSYTWYTKGWPTFNVAPAHDFWVISPFLYASFNLSLALAVLVPLASESKNPTVLWAGGMIGGLGLGLLLFLSNYSLTAYFYEIINAEIPMAKIVSHWHPLLHGFFNLIIFGEIFTTLVGNIFGLTKQVHSLYPEISSKRWMIILIFIAYVISQFGFSKLIHLFYPVFGYISIGTFALLLLRKKNKGPVI